MFKASGWILTAGLIMGGAGIAGGQTASSSGDPGVVPALLPAEMAEMQKVQSRLMKDADPEFFSSLELLRNIKEESEKIVERFRRQEIDKTAAQAELLPLSNQEQEIRNDPNFLVEKKLWQVILSSPKFQEKMKKAMAKLIAKRGANPAARQP